MVFTSASQTICVSQVNKDSLKKVWQNTSLKEDQRMNALYDLAWDGYLFSNPDSSFIVAQQLYDFAKSKNNSKGMSNALNTQGASFYIQGKYDSAIIYYKKNIALLKKSKNNSDLGDAYNNIGLLYDERGDHVTALDYFSKSLKLKEKQKDLKGVAIALNNIGNIYFSQSEYQPAIENYKKSTAIYQKLEDKKGLAGTYNNIANVFKTEGQLDSALHYQNKCLHAYEKINYSLGIAGSYNNLGMIHQLKNEIPTAIDFFNRSIEISEPINDQLGLANSYSNLSGIFLQMTEEAKTKNALQEYQSHKSKAKEYAQLAFKYANETGAVLERRNVALALYKINKLEGNYKLALEMQDLYFQLRDSLNTEENQKAVIRQKFKTDYEIKSAQDSIHNAEAKKVLNAEIKTHELEAKNQKQRNYFLFAGLALTLVFLLFIINRFRITNKQKKIIEHQKHQVDETLEKLEEKQKEITDSINYAQRLQQAILAPESAIRSVFPESFLLYQPKDIVAGDFYFFEKTATHIFYAAADSTGHGVPGAMVSVVCSNALTRCVKEFNLNDPGEILDKAREMVISTFEKSGMDVKDGMDISLVAMVYRTNASDQNKIEITHVKWAGANNPLWYSHNGEMIEVKADKQPIGKTENPKPFLSHELNIGKDSMIFLLTDGYADQFGGPKGKKFKYAPLQDLLKNHSSEKPDDTKLKLKHTFQQWKGSLEQVDDVTLIGFKLP